MRHFHYHLKPLKGGVLMIVLSFIFMLSVILMMLTNSFHHQKLANREVKHYFQRQIMKQLLLADYQKNPTKYDKEGVVNYNIGQIHYQNTTDELILWIYLKSDSMKIRDSLSISVSSSDETLNTAGDNIKF